MPQHPLRTTWAMLCLLLLAAAPMATAATSETLDLYRGQPLEGLKGLTFSGTSFDAEGIKPVPRQDVQSVEFRLEQGQAAAATQAAPAELSPLAAEMLPQGKKLAQENPGVGGVILVDDGTFVYHKDGTSSYSYHFAGLVLKDEMKSWAQLGMGYTEGRSRVRVLYARAVNPDGTIHELSPEDMHATSPSEDIQFFNPNRKVLSGVIPGVDIGSIVEYAYEFDMYNPENPKLFFPGYYFQSTEPVALSRVRVDIPSKIHFNYVTRNWPKDESSDPKESTEKGVTSYTWELRDVPPLDVEPMMPPEHDLVPMMEGSIFESWDAVYSLQRAMQEARIQPTEDIKQAVARITEGCKTDAEKLARLYYWVQTNTRYISIKSSLSSGLSGHTAEETFENRYGDCTDKAMLFSAMCKAAGITAYPVILTTTDAGKAVTEIPTLTGNHCINEVVLDNKHFFLDTTAQDYRYPYFRTDDHGAIAFNSILGKHMPIPVPPPKDNARFSHLNITLNDEGDMVVKTVNKYTGTIEAGIRSFWRYQREDERNLLMAQYVNQISPGAVLKDFSLSDLSDLNQQVSMTIDYDLPKSAIVAKKLLYFTLPTVPRDYPEVSLDTRKFPIQYMTTEERVLDIDLNLPKGYGVDWTPPALDFDSPYLQFHAAYETKDGVLHYRETFRRLKRIVPPEDYPAYRDALRAIAAFSQKDVFLKKGS